jgi:hypothetical protein
MSIAIKILTVLLGINDLFAPKDLIGRSSGNVVHSSILFLIDDSIRLGQAMGGKSTVDLWGKMI